MLWVLVVAVFEGETSVLMVHVFAYAPESGVAFRGFCLPAKRLDVHL